MFLLETNFCYTVMVGTMKSLNMFGSFTVRYLHLLLFRDDNWLLMFFEILISLFFN